MITTVLVLLCFAVSAACAILLLRAWRRTKLRLLMFSGLGFSGIALNNLLLVVDASVVSDLSIWRETPTLVGLGIFIWGLIGERHQ
ncbi:MAG: DUF5985 family protein [Thermoanaerobaculia bacterium]